MITEQHHDSQGFHLTGNKAVKGHLKRKEQTEPCNSQNTAFTPRVPPHSGSTSKTLGLPVNF